MKTPAQILVVDDDEDVLITAEVVLKQKFKTVDCISSPELIKEQLSKTEYDVVLLDMNYQAGDASGKEGLKWLSWIRDNSPRSQVLMITAYGELNLAVEAMKRGAVDFVTKPWQYLDIQEKVDKAFQLGQTKEGANIIQNGKASLNTANTTQSRMIGQSPKMQLVEQMVDKVAPTDANVLILGENGTGKEVTARMIHERSQRMEKAFVHVDMGSLTESLFESELFGHAKGAFTDAISDREGRFEAAHGGTIFLDEIGNLSLPMQSKLLNVLQRRVVTRVGEHKERPIDVRVLAATNADLNEMVNSGAFREDLLYRLNTLEILLPPLRERGKDVLALTDHFIDDLGKRYGKSKATLSKAAQELMLEYHWPGNVRELEHTLERAMIMSSSEVIEASDLLMRSTHQKGNNISTTNLEELEKITIEEVIRQHDGNMSKVAKALGIGRTTLYRKLEKYGL